jgi:hypothetical protein
MMQIPIEELMASLESGYTEYKECKAAGYSQVDLAYVKGFCATIEKILAAYGGVTAEDMMKIKEPILGDESLQIKIGERKELDMNANFDEPTILRRQK